MTVPEQPTAPAEPAVEPAEGFAEESAQRIPGAEGAHDGRTRAADGPQQPGFAPPPPTGGQHQQSGGQQQAGQAQFGQQFGQAPQFGAQPPYGQQTGTQTGTGTGTGYPPPYQGYGQGYGYGYPSGYPGYPGYPQQGGTNGMAIAAMVCGICGFLCLVPGLIGIILGIVSLPQIKRSQQAGRGMAITGIVTGAVWIAVFVLLLIIGHHSQPSPVVGPGTAAA
jgi:Domain of unknown function (DUF4190)